MLPAKIRHCMRSVTGREFVSRKWKARRCSAIRSIGDQFPAHAGATGKVLPAHLPRGELKKYLDSAIPLTRLTPRTITDPKKLLLELARIRKRGVAFSCGERVMDGLCAISAPIFDSDGQVHYCLTVTLTPFRRQAKGKEKLFNVVKEAAKAISLKMGARVGNSQLISPRSSREKHEENDSGTEKKRIFV
jgi:DNA-binding IclR family transcriptional regulator